MPSILAPLIALAAVACSSPVQTPSSQQPITPPGANYLAFSSADQLARYMADDSDAGLIISAHRGGPQPGFPENCLETFEKTLDYGPMMIECDVRQTSDGYLVLMHDDTVDRTTTGKGKVSEESFGEIRRLRLVDNDGSRTDFKVPTLGEALSWAEGRAILSLDVKQGVPFEKVVDAVQRHKAQNRVQIITYNLSDLKRSFSLDRTIHQSASADTIEEVNGILSSGVDLKRVSVFTGVGKINPDVIHRLKARGIRCALGTFGDIDEQAEAEGRTAFNSVIRAGIGIIATDVPWAVNRSTAGSAAAN